MTVKRSYGEACGLAHAGELIGERWALLVIRELVLGPKRFTDLRAGIPRVSPKPPRSPDSKPRLSPRCS